jgi:hypothetical protein
MSSYYLKKQRCPLPKSKASQKPKSSRRGCISWLIVGQHSTNHHLRRCNSLASIPARQPLERADRHPARELDSPARLFFCLHINPPLSTRRKGPWCCTCMVEFSLAVLHLPACRHKMTVSRPQVGSPVKSDESPSRLEALSSVFLLIIDQPAARQSVWTYHSLDPSAARQSSGHGNTHHPVCRQSQCPP